MSSGFALLRKMIEEKRTARFMDEVGIDAELFAADELPVYEFIRAHIASEGAMPSMGTVVAETGVKFQVYPDEPITFWVRKVRKRFQSLKLLDLANRLKAAVVQGDIDDAREEITVLSAELDRHQGVQQVWEYSELLQPVVDHQHKRKRMTELSGIPFGIPHLDYVSDGAQPGDSVALVARPGVGKSYVLLNCARHANIAGEVPVVISMEMPRQQCARRLLALDMNLPAEHLRLGRLSTRMEQILENTYQKVTEGRPPLYIVEGGLNMGVETLLLRVKELKPTVVYVDGAYLLKPQRGSTAKARWERIAEAAETIKMLALDLNIPFIATYQFNRDKGASLKNIAGSDVIGQIASIVLGMMDSGREATEGDRIIKRYYKYLEILKGREGERGIIHLVFNMTRMLIEQIEVLNRDGTPVDNSDD